MSATSSSFSRNQPANRKPPQCLCGNKRYYSKCYYLNESLRPANWTPNQDVTKKVQQALDNDKQLRDKVRQAQARVQENRQKQASQSELEGAKLQITPSAGSAFIAIFTADQINKVHTVCELRDSFLLDSGATIHICNNIRRFTDLRPGSGSILAGDTVVDIEAWGTVNINVNTPNGKAIVPLLDVAYIPSFHTSLVPLKKALSRGFHWNTETMTITNGTNVIMTVKLMFD